MGDQKPRDDKDKIREDNRRQAELAQQSERERRKRQEQDERRQNNIFG